ncbi:MAG: helix-turn-helix transcriptional regulator [Bacteroidetes bacterium]|nr:helix-turn-helix transcriptional regulator [Bacteroidota bacterium]
MIVHKVRNERLLLRLGKNLKKARTLRGMTQEDLADKSGLALSQIARIETGRINSTFSTLYVIIKALGAEASELFEQ